MAAAASALEEARRASPAATLPAEVIKLGDLPKEQDPFAKARALGVAGAPDEAKAELKKVISDHPDQSVPPDLRYLADGLVREWWNAGLWNGALALLLDIAVAAAALALIFLVLLPILRRLFGVRIEIKALDGEDDLKIGTSLATLIEAELFALRSEGMSSSPQFTVGPDSPLKIPDAVASIAAPIKVLSALLELIPSRIYTLSGTLEPRGPRGVGIAVRITAPGGTVCTSTQLWQKDFDPMYAAPQGTDDAKTEAAVTAYQHLALAAASWAIYQPPIDPRDRLTHGYLTRQWRSYAAHRVAASWQREEQTERARRLYFSALQFDPENVGALFNLGQLEGDEALATRPPNDHLFDLAIAHARLARDIAEGRRSYRTPQDFGGDRLAYRIHYGVARLDHHRTLIDPSRVDARDLMTEAESEAAQVLQQAHDFRTDPRSAHKAGSDLDRFIDLVEAATMVMLCGIWHGFATRKELDLPRLPLPKGVAKGDNRREPGPTIEATIKLHQTPRDRAGLDRGVRYNLACYFALLGDPNDEKDAYLKKATDELADCLTPSLAKQARNDPTLDNLTKPKWKARFEAVLGLFGPALSKKEYALARVQRIGAFAVPLAEHQVTTADELETWVKEPSLRAKLAKDIGASIDLLVSWRDMLGLRELRGRRLRVEDAELLYEAGLKAPADLRSRDARTLSEYLISLNRGLGLTETPPDESTVRDWIAAET